MVLRPFLLLKPSSSLSLSYIFSLSLERKAKIQNWLCLLLRYIPIPDPLIHPTERIRTLFSSSRSPPRRPPNPTWSCRRWNPWRRRSVSRSPFSASSYASSPRFRSASSTDSSPAVPPAATSTPPPPGLFSRTSPSDSLRICISSCRWPWVTPRWCSVESTAGLLLSVWRLDTSLDGMFRLRLLLTLFSFFFFFSNSMLRLLQAWYFPV